MMMSRSLLVVALACAVACAAASVPRSEEEYESMFSAFTDKFGKAYESHAERAYRLGVFKQNLDFIAKHNAEADAGVHSFWLGVNQFADLSNAEYQLTRLGLKRHNAAGPSGEAVSTVDVSDLPASFDWRTKGAVVPVKNQGQCGSCWAFSATAAMEGAHFQKTGQLVSFSEQLCVDCVNGGKDTCTAGGEMHDCYLQIMKEGGEMKESDYPYKGTSGNSCGFDKSKAVVTPFTGYTNVTSGDEGALQKATTEHVISVGIDASSMWFQLYSTGVFDLASCKKAYNELDHGVTVVGYGSDSGKDYWIVRNSWGETWGKSGYIWMSRNKDNQCGIATDATFPNY